MHFAWEVSSFWIQVQTICPSLALVKDLDALVADAEYCSDYSKHLDGYGYSVSAYV